MVCLVVGLLIMTGLVAVIPGAWLALLYSLTGNEYKGNGSLTRDEAEAERVQHERIMQNRVRWDRAQPVQRQGEGQADDGDVIAR